MLQGKIGKTMKTIIALAVTLAMASGCANMTSKQRGAVVGAAAGAALGGASGPLITHDRDSDDRGKAAIIGIVAGGIIGGVVGYLTAQDAPPPKAEVKTAQRTEASSVKETVKETPKEKSRAESTVKERIVLRGINFDYDKADIKKEFKPILDEAASILKKRSDVNVAVEGHTCSMGTEKYNQGLSDRRAKSVYDYLTSAGIDKKQLSSIGKGESQPVADNKTEEGRRMNRRVEFKVMQ